MVRHPIAAAVWCDLGKADRMRRTRARASVREHHRGGRELAQPLNGVALILPGGKVRSHARSRPWHLSVVRMRPFGRSIHREIPSAEVWDLRYRFRGWNGSETSPVADAQWALDQVRERYGEVPVVLIGHSMGGRTALRLCGDPSVVGVVALAPWLPPGEPLPPAGSGQLLIAHGNRDRWTDPAASLQYALAATETAKSVRYVEVAGETHAMLKRPRLWHDLATEATKVWFAASSPLTSPDQAPHSGLDQSLVDLAPNEGHVPLLDRVRIVR
jgi:pimeloyl-ACP methyl ester carboxylesterase